MGKTYSVMYRKGGTVNFEWVRVLDAYITRDDADKVAADLERMGYPAKIYDTAQLNAIGGPDTYA